MVELEIYAMGEPTGAKITIAPASSRICVDFPEEVRARLGKR